MIVARFEEPYCLVLSVGNISIKGVNRNQGCEAGRTGTLEGIRLEVVVTVTAPPPSETALVFLACGPPNV